MTRSVSIKIACVKDKLHLSPLLSTVIHFNKTCVKAVDRSIAERSRQTSIGREGRTFQAKTHPC